MSVPKEFRTCVWSEDEDGTWETECGNAFVIEAGSPTENDFRFCTYCGAELVEEPSREDQEEI